ncbi:MAG: hypothetical protein KJ592_00110 [Nanoarchaeota archaeon]|nr:hypothetical protein [Nanoarchaeota archaeon]
MSSNARWRRLKIVEALTSGKTVELMGGLRNALERGETLEKAKKSFISAGYTEAEVDDATRKLKNTEPEVESKPKTVTNPNPTNPNPTNPNPTKSLPASQNPKLKKHLSKFFIITASIIVVIILVGAAIFGLYWNKIF